MIVKWKPFVCISTMKPCQGSVKSQNSSESHIYWKLCLGMDTLYDTPFLRKAPGGLNWCMYVRIGYETIKSKRKEPVVCIKWFNGRLMHGEVYPRCACDGKFRNTNLTRNPRYVHGSQIPTLRITSYGSLCAMTKKQTGSIQVNVALYDQICQNLHYSGGLAKLA